MTDGQLQHLDRLVGTWATEATHPAMPDVVVHGISVFEWLEGEHFLIYRGRTDHAAFPDSISVLGYVETDRIDPSPAPNPAGGLEQSLSMHYFDSRGVFRVYEAHIDDRTWRLQRHAPGFSQRFTGTYTDGGNTLGGQWQMSEDDVTWHADLQITFRRQP